MSTMTLKLPMNYVEIEREEMEYVDGGGYSVEIVTGRWNCVEKLSVLCGLGFGTASLIASGVATAMAAGLTIPGAIAAASQIIIGLIGSVWYLSFLATGIVYTIKDNGFKLHSYDTWFNLGSKWITRLY